MKSRRCPRSIADDDKSPDWSGLGSPAFISTASACFPGAGWENGAFAGNDDEFFCSFSITSAAALGRSGCRLGRGQDGGERAHRTRQTTIASAGLEPDATVRSSSSRPRIRGAGRSRRLEAFGQLFSRSPRRAGSATPSSCLATMCALRHQQGDLRSAASRHSSRRRHRPCRMRRTAQG